MAAAANDPLPTLHELIAAAVQEALDKRLPTLAALGLVPPRYVLPPIASVVTGLTEGAITKKMDAGVWREGHEYRKAPDGKRYVDLRGYERWVEGGRKGDDQ